MRTTNKTGRQEVSESGLKFSISYFLDESERSFDMMRIASELVFLIVLVCSIMLTGCKNRENEQAQVDAAEANILLTKVRGDLARTKKNLNDLSEELQAVKDARDELDEQVEQLTANRDDAIAATEAAEEKINNLTVQLNEQHESLVLLEKEIEVLKALVESQQATIAEQQTTITELQATIVELETLIQVQTIPEEQQEEIEVPEIEEQEEIPEPEEIGV
jgi:chromosome segregation ATPase